MTGVYHLMHKLWFEIGQLWLFSVLKNILNNVDRRVVSTFYAAAELFFFNFFSLRQHI